MNGFVNKILMNYIAEKTIRHSARRKDIARATGLLSENKILS